MIWGLVVFLGSALVVPHVAGQVGEWFWPKTARKKAKKIENAPLVVLDGRLKMEDR